MINFLINTIATGFYDEEIILKHEAMGRAGMNITLNGFLGMAIWLLIMAF